MQVLAGGNNHSLIVDPCGRVWAVGPNESGELGLGHEDTTETFTQITSPPDQVVGVSAGYECSYFLDDKGQMWSCGDNTNGRLGLPNITKTNIPTLVPNLSSIVSVSCGEEFAIALDLTGGLWGCGSNILSIANGNKQVDQFTKIDTSLIGTVTNVSCGDTFCIVLNNSGEVWASGSNTYGQLGFSSSDVEQVEAFTKTCSGIEKVFVAVYCGGLHTLLLDSDGVVWGSGDNSQGQVGLGNQDPIDKFTSIKTEPRIRAICAGSSFSLIVSEENELYGCGNNEFGQLGVGSMDDTREEFEKAKGALKVAQVTAGVNHTLVVDLEGALWGCGYNDENSLGLDPEERFVDTFTKVEDVQVKCGDDLRRTLITKRARDAEEVELKVNDETKTDLSTEQNIPQEAKSGDETKTDSITENAQNLSKEVEQEVEAKNKETERITSAKRARDPLDDEVDAPPMKKHCPNVDAKEI